MMYTANTMKAWRDRVIPEPNSGCWLWEGASSKGYGQVFRGRKLIYVHRLAWEEVNGPIPDDLLVLHRCDVRACCNPDHLFLGTPLTNMQDMHAKGRARIVGDRHNARKTHCKHGHLFDAANTRIDGRGWRQCRQCDRIAKRAT